MEWDLKEPEALTSARLMAASLEFVYQQLKFYGKQRTHRFLSTREGKLEAALLTRDNQLINLALAQFAFDNKVVKTLYDGTNNTDEYNLGLRIACLSNGNFLDELNWVWEDIGFFGAICQGANSRRRALVAQSAIESDKHIAYQSHYPKLGS